ncbi:MAG: hypothetical protein R3335_11575, partial [Anaerolineales bacterium]|nr:hypothetical protein [Anaerolineales bacterium]
EFAIVGGSDGTLILWNLETGEAIRKHSGHDGTVTHVVFTPDGRFAYSTGFDGVVRIWPIHRTTDELVEWAEENRYIRELTCQERELYQVEPLCE